MSAEVFFIDADTAAVGQRLCVFHPPRGVLRGWVVYVHPFAEEMNKSRRMAALQARALADVGFGVLQIDLHGCGDSSGDFGEATWQGWVDDVVQACRWLRRRDAGMPLWLWGFRAGCLLAVEAAARLADAAQPAGGRVYGCNFLFWQPAPAGKVLLQQFLRLRMAGELIAGGGGKGVIDALRRQLDAGTPVEVAGYVLSPALASGLEHATLTPPPGALRAEWFEITQRPAEGDTPPASAPASLAAAERWRAAGAALRSHIVSGPAFWQTTEIEDAPALVAATLDALADAPHAAATASLRHDSVPAAAHPVTA